MFPHVHLAARAKDVPMCLRYGISSLKNLPILKADVHDQTCDECATTHCVADAVPLPVGASTGDRLTTTDEFGWPVLWTWASPSATLTTTDADGSTVVTTITPMDTLSTHRTSLFAPTTTSLSETTPSLGPGLPILSSTVGTTALSGISSSSSDQVMSSSAASSLGTTGTSTTGTTASSSPSSTGPSSTQPSASSAPSSGANAALALRTEGLGSIMLAMLLVLSCYHSVLRRA
jgi:hypothetical protein